MIGRRVAVLLQLPAQSRVLRTSGLPHHSSSPVRTLLSAPRRAYATPGRPRKAVGEPSRPVKRAVKRNATQATSSENSAAKQKTDARKKTAAKKDAAKKSAAKKAPAKKPKKQLTEEQKALKEAKAAKLKTSELKKAALQPPKLSKKSAYTAYVAEQSQGVKAMTAGKTDPKEILQIAQTNLTETAKRWKACTPAEVEVSPCLDFFPHRPLTQSKLTPAS